MKHKKSAPPLPSQTMLMEEDVTLCGLLDNIFLGGRGGHTTRLESFKCNVSKTRSYFGEIINIFVRDCLRRNFAKTRV